MNTRILVSGLSLLMALCISSCKEDPIPEPIVYNFDDAFGTVELPEVTEEEPAAVNTTEAEVTESATTAAAIAALEAGGTTPELDAAATAVANTNTEDELIAFLAAFTTAVDSSLAAGGSVSDLTAGGTVPASVQNTIDALIASGALEDFLSTLVLPTVDGQEVSARKGDSKSENTSSLKNDVELFLGIQNACNDAALSAFNDAKAILDAAKASQDAAADNNFNAREAAITETLQSDNTQTLTQYSATRVAWIARMNTTIAATSSDAIKAFFQVVKVQGLGMISDGQAVQLNANTIKNVKATANSEAARTDVKANIASQYATSLAPIQTEYNRINNDCHDQGGV